MSDRNDELTRAARAAQRHAYAPYSGFHVGCALRTTAGSVYAGCNVENASYGLTNCAERIAIGAAVANGARPGSIAEIVLVSDAPVAISPCGACRQVLLELAPAAVVRMVPSDPSLATNTVPVRDLLPDAFAAEHLPR